MRKSTLILVVLLALLTLGVGAMMMSSSAAPGADGASQTLKWQVGQKQRYTVDVRARIAIDGEAQVSYAHQLAGDLDVQVFAADADGVHLGCQLSKVKQSVDGEARNEPLLSSFFAVTASTDGRFVEFEFPQSLPSEMRGRLRELMRTFQIVVPFGATETWRTDEKDANGAFVSVYRVAAEGKLHKARLRYLTDTAKVLGSRTTAQIAKAGSWLASLDADEERSVRSASGDVVVATIRAELRLVGKPLAWRDDLAVAMPKADSAVVEVQRAVEKQRARPATAADRKRFRDLIAQLEKAGKLGNGLLDALRDAMLDHPELAKMVPGLVRDGGLADFTAATLIHALRLAGNDAAQTSLQQIAKDPVQSAQNRARAVMDLGGVARPNRASSTQLWELARQRYLDENLANTALLALGRVGRSLREFDAARYDAMRSQIRQTLVVAVDDGERATVLTAMGNTSDPSLGADVTIHLESAQSQVRAAAAKALGRLGGAGEQIVGRLGNEDTATVRRQLVESLRTQGKATQAGLQRVNSMISGEPDAQTRLAMARYLGENVKVFPEAKSTLEKLLKDESSNRIRRYVAGVVYAK